MNNRRRILKFWGCFLMLLAVALGVITAVTRWHRIFPTDEVSDIYAKYAGIDGIEAAFVKDYKVNDTAFIDATVLEAKTDSAWAVLQNDFNVPIIPEEYRELINHTINFHLAPKNNPQAPADSIMLNNDFIAVSRQAQTISIFHLTSETQIDIIFYEKAKEIHN